MSIVSGALKGTFVLVIGMQLIGVGLWLNGDDQPSNFAWQMVRAFYNFELGVLAALLILAAVAGALMFTQTVSEKSTDLDTSAQNKMSKPQMRHEETQVKIATPVEDFVNKKQAVDAQATIAESVQPVPSNPLSTPKAEPSAVPPLSAEELRKNVLRELTGRS